MGSITTNNYAFNDYYVSIGPELVSKAFSRLTVNLLSYVKTNYHTIDSLNVSSADVTAVINLSNNSNAGYDKFPKFVLKKYIGTLIEPISYLINKF